MIHLIHIADAALHVVAAVGSHGALRYHYVKPRSSCSTQTYKVPSEDGGDPINVVRC